MLIFARRRFNDSNRNRKPNSLLLIIVILKYTSITKISIHKHDQYKPVEIAIFVVALKSCQGEVQCLEQITLGGHAVAAWRCAALTGKCTVPGYMIISLHHYHECIKKKKTLLSYHCEDN